MKPIFDLFDSEVEHQIMIKKVKKLKNLEEENKKLKTLLKSQLDTSEKLRVETFSTVEALKNEFSFLLGELNFKKQQGRITPVSEGPD